MTAAFDKVATGIAGLDSVLHGGFPKASPVLVAGGPGAGKTVMALSFAAAAEPCVFITCEERIERLLAYMDALGMGGTRLRDEGRLRFLDFRPELSDEVIGAYELDVLRLRIDQAVQALGARRLVIDSLDNLTLGMAGDDLRPDLLALFDWTRESGLTTLITMSPFMATHRFESYAADCVIHVSQEINDHLMTRYLRVVKMRGTPHGTNEYPFLLDDYGITVMPVTETELKAKAPTSRVSTGVRQLDEMLGGGYLDGSAVIISGASGAGKSILAASILEAALEAGRRAFYISFEESPDELTRNFRSVGIDVARFAGTDQLQMHSLRSVEAGLETHLIQISRLVEASRADLVVLDPVSALTDLGTAMQVKMMLVRFTSRMKSLGATLLMTELLADYEQNVSHLNISSQADVWIKLRQTDQDGTLQRRIHVVKARGSATSDRVREFTIGSAGFQIGKS